MYLSTEGTIFKEMYIQHLIQISSTQWWHVYGQNLKDFLKLDIGIPQKIRRKAIHKQWLLRQIGKFIKKTNIVYNKETRINTRVFVNVINLV